MIEFAITGGCIVKRRFSVCQDERFTRLVDVIRKADVGFAHLEGTIADDDAPEVFPAAEAGWTWIRNPSYYPEELKWAGFDLVSHASNHTMDYMYGGLYATWSALQQAGIPYAGSGMTLKEARQPAFLDTPKGRVALISSSTSTPDWARAADPIRNDRGRPGANQLRLIQQIDRRTADELRGMAQRLGWWMSEIDDDIVVSPPGLHNTVKHYRVVPGSTFHLVPDPEDVEANLEAIRAARKQADFVIFHIHNHEWDPVGGLPTPPNFVRELAHQCVDAGADIFIGEGAHALLRGIEVYGGKPIFYDPGDLFKDGNAKTRPLSEYYWVQGHNPRSGKWELTPESSRVHVDKKKIPVPTNPAGGYSTGKVLAVVVPVCRFDDQGRLEQITIHPAVHLKDDATNTGLPGLQTGEDARRIIDYLGELSAPFGTHIEFADGVGVIRP
jgi:poly-gamma-glutamate capsule biosynthesis protein CapA/YwtB (metallophosphatase superfamily)